MEDFLSKRENHKAKLHEFVGEIQGLETASVGLLKEGQPSFNGPVYEHILKNFNSAIMCSPQSEECSALLKILDRLEERIFGEASSEGIRQDSDEANSTDTFNSYECDGQQQHPRPFSVFDQQHPTSPVSGQNPRSRSSCSSASVDFNSALQDSFRSPSESTESCLSETSRNDFHSVTHGDLNVSKSICFRRTVRRLENAFVECNSSATNTESSGIFRNFEFLNSRTKSAVSSTKQRTKKNSTNDCGSQSLIGYSKRIEPVKAMQFIRGKKSSDVTDADFLQKRRCHSSDGVPEVACRPLMLVSKASRHRMLPSRIEQEAKWRSSSIFSEKQTSSEQMIKGSLQCVEKDGGISYNLWLEETEELLVARPMNQDISEDQELCDKVFVFFSYKCKGRGKPGWMQWGKKEKPAVEVLGKMKIFSTVIPEMDRGRNRHFLDSDFLLFEAKKITREQSVSSPQLIGSSSRRLSFSSWDATPSDSPNKTSIKSSFESPMLRTPEKPGTPHFSFFKQKKDQAVMKQSDSWDSFKPEGVVTATSFVEIGAVVTRVPIQMKKRSNSMNSSHLNSWESRLKRNNRSASLDERHEKMNVTVVLPAGDHGCPAYGLPGPQSLLERWRGGGACDCGSWDLGCGLRVLENQQSVRCSAKAAQERAGSISVVVQGKKREVALRLTPLYDDDTFSVSLQQPLSTLQAFGTAVAMLHSRTKPEKLFGEDQTRRPVELKKKFVAKLPVRAPSSGMFQEALTGFPKIRRVYSLGCHPEPLSLVERV